MYQPPKMVEAVLKNGMRAICIQAPSKIARIAFLIAIGSADDGEQYGTAHLLEHLLANGEQNRPAYQSFLNWENRGLDPYAYTSYKTTGFSFEGPANIIPRTIPELAEKIFVPMFTGEDVKRERKIILEEYRETKGDDEAQVALHRFFFPKYPEIWHSAVGYPASIRKLTLRTCQSFHQKWYGAQNTLFVYSGPEPSEKILPILDALSIPIAKQKAQIPITSILPMFRDGKINKQAYPGILVCTAVPENFMERQKMHILHQLLEVTLFKKLRIQKALIYGTDSEWNMLPCNMHALRIPVQTRRIPTVTTMTQEVLRAFSEGRIPKTNLRTSQHRLERERQLNKEQLHADREKWIDTVCEAWLLGASVEDLREMDSWQIDWSEIKKLARTYFHPDRIGILQLIP